MYKIIVDSCCDLTTELKNRIDAALIPLTMRLGTKEYPDDSNLNLKSFMADMRACKEPVGSASPNPDQYQQAILRNPQSFIVTLSSRLSGSFSSAQVAKTMAEEQGPVDVHIFDSKSASAGQTLVALKLKEALEKGLSKEQIVKTVTDFIDNMKTYFVLDRYDNLLKNGRLNKITGKIASILNIKLLMGSDGDDNIALFAKPRGTGQMIEKLLCFIHDSGKQTSGETMVISHCNNPTLAERLTDEIKQHFDFSQIHVIPTGGLSSLYADDQGVVMAF